MHKLKFAIVGCGSVALRHAEQIERLAKLEAVCDVVSSRAIKIAEKFKSKVYDDIDKPDMLWMQLIEQ